jgi:hypothetical protein
MTVHCSSLPLHQMVERTSTCLCLLAVVLNQLNTGTNYSFNAFLLIVQRHFLGFSTEPEGLPGSADPFSFPAVTQLQRFASKAFGILYAPCGLKYTCPQVKWSYSFFLHEIICIIWALNRRKKVLTGHIYVYSKCSFTCRTVIYSWLVTWLRHGGEGEERDLPCEYSPPPLSIVYGRNAVTECLCSPSFC